MSEFTEQTKRRIALFAGEDLESDLCAQTRRSVESCPQCRSHWMRLRGCLDVLERAGKALETRPVASLWPAIAAQLQPSTTVRRTERFNGWVPALSMAAACIALLVAGQRDRIVPEFLGNTPHDATLKAGSLRTVLPVNHQSPNAPPAGTIESPPAWSHMESSREAVPVDPTGSPSDDLTGGEWEQSQEFNGRSPF